MKNSLAIICAVFSFNCIAMQETTYEDRVKIVQDHMNEVPNYDESRSKIIDGMAEEVRNISRAPNKQESTAANALLNLFYSDEKKIDEVRIVDAESFIS